MIEQTSIEYQIRPARNDDIEGIYRIEAESFSQPWCRENFIDEMNIFFSTIIVAEGREGVIGYAVAWKVLNEIHLNRIAVKKEYRRKGVGVLLLNDITMRLCAAGPGVILLEVREKSIGVRAFYLSQGFRENGIRKNYYTDDNAVLMEKSIN